MTLLSESNSGKRLFFNLVVLTLERSIQKVKVSFASSHYSSNKGGAWLLHAVPSDCILFKYQHYLYTRPKSWKVTRMVSSDCNKVSQLPWGDFLNSDKGVPPFGALCARRLFFWRGERRQTGKGARRVRLAASEEVDSNQASLRPAGRRFHSRVFIRALASLRY